MKFGKLANLKKWHLLWVAGRQMWPNGNGNGNIIAKSWYIGLGYCCQFSVNWHRHSLGWWQKSNWLGRSWCEWRPRKPSAATRWAPTTTNSWAPSGVSLSMNVALYLCLRVFCIFVFLPLHSVHFIHRLPAISLVTQDGWQQPCPDPNRSFTVCCWFWIPSLFILELNKSMLSPRLLMASKPMSDAMRSAQLMSSALRWNHNLFWPDMLGPKLTQY